MYLEFQICIWNSKQRISNFEFGWRFQAFVSLDRLSQGVIYMRECRVVVPIDLYSDNNAELKI